jgi:hypothetical protein
MRQAGKEPPPACDEVMPGLIEGVAVTVKNSSALGQSGACAALGLTSGDSNGNGNSNAAQTKSGGSCLRGSSRPNYFP